MTIPVTVEPWETDNGVPLAKVSKIDLMTIVMISPLSGTAATRMLSSIEALADAEGVVTMERGAFLTLIASLSR